MFNFNNEVYRDDKVVISCRKCSQKLRVPKSMGKLSVSCPICKSEFIFDPNDVVFKITSYVKNVFDSLKKSTAHLKWYKDALNQVLKQLNGRYRR